jgi:hypothetical protein
MNRRVVGVALAALLLAVPAQATRPLGTTETAPVASGRWSLEAGVAYWGDSGCDHYDIPLCLTYGLPADVNIALGFGGQAEERVAAEGHRVRESGISDLAGCASWRYIEQSGWFPSQAALFTVKFPTADRDKGLGSGSTDYDLTWAATSMLSDVFQADINAGYSWIGHESGEEAEDVFHYGLALEARLIGPLQWVGEVVAERELGGGGETAGSYDAGFRWNPMEQLTFDLAAGSRIRGDAPSFAATVGVSWEFGPAGSE